MLDFAGLNPWAIGVVWLLYISVGAFWYSPAGFAKQWTKHTGIDIMKMPKDDANKAIGFVAASAIVQAYTLAVILHSLHIVGALDGLITGVFLWFGLTAATTVGVTLYSRKSWSYLWLNSSYFLLVMALGSVILAVWQ